MARDYRLLCDWDQDGYMCRGVQPSDALNVIRGAGHKGMHAVAANPSTYPALVLATQSAHLLAYWRSNDLSGSTAADESGNGRTGAYVNAVPAAGKAFADGSVAPNFDGATDYVNAYSASLAGAFNGQLGSMMVWLRVADAATWADSITRYAYVFAAPDAGSSYIFVSKPSSNNALVLLYRAAGTQHATSVASTSTDWIQAVITWSKAADQVKFYVNGAQVGSTATGLGTWSAALGATTTNLGSNTSGASAWKGSLSNAAVWDVVLSASEIAALYAAGNAAAATEVARTYGEYDGGLITYQQDATGTSEASRVYLGSDDATLGTASSFPVSPSTAYAVRAQVRANAGSTDGYLGVRDEAGAALGAGTTFTLSVGSWVDVAYTFTTGAASAYASVLVQQTTPDAANDFEVRGLMIVPGSTMPTAFNAGDASNAYDDVTAYVRDSVSFTDGLPRDDDFCAPSSFLAQLDNTSDFWNPNNVSSPVYGKFKRGLLMQFEAERSGTMYPLWRGTIARLGFTGEDGVNPIATLEAEDAALLMTDSEYTPRFLENVRVDEALKDVFDSGAFIWPYTGAFGVLDATGYSELDSAFILFEERLTDFREADTTLPYAGDNIDRGSGTNVQMYLRELLACEAGGRFFYDAPTGKYVFHNRLRDVELDLTEWTPGNPLDYPVPEWVWGDDVINHVDLFYETRLIGDPLTVVYTYEDVPISLAAGKSRTINARFTSTDTEAQIAVKDGVFPAAGTDWDAAYTDGAMESALTALVFYVEWAANTAKITVTNFTGRPVDITLLQLRGTPITVTKAQQVTSRVPLSIAQHGLHKLSLNVRSINDETFAQQYADVRAQRQSDPIKQLRTIAFAADESTDSEDMVLSAKVGDVLNVDAGDGASKYLVLARNHQIAVDSEFHMVSYTVKAFVRPNVIILDSEIRGLIDYGVIGL